MQPWGAAGAMDAPSSVWPQLHLGVGARAAPAHPRGAGHGAGAHRPRQPAVPHGSGCQGSAGTLTPTAGVPRSGSLGFFPSLPSAFPSASNFSSSAKTNPQVSRAGAASGSVQPAHRGGLLPASLLTALQPRQSRQPRVPGADCCCLPARGGKASYIDPWCRRARTCRPTAAVQATMGELALALLALAALHGAGAPGKVGSHPRGPMGAAGRGHPCPAGGWQRRCGAGWGWG